MGKRRIAYPDIDKAAEVQPFGSELSHDWLMTIESKRLVVSIYILEYEGLFLGASDSSTFLQRFKTSLSGKV